MRPSVASLILAFSLVFLGAPAALAQQCPASVPVQGAAPPPPLPVFPADNWWNQDIRTAPVDSNSANYIAYINNGGTRHLHPDFGGEESPGSTAVYGFPYAIVDGSQTPLAVTFDTWDESDGVDMNTGAGVPFYPIPAQAIAQTHWIESGSPGNVDERDDNDRHLLIIDCTHNFLYELYNVYYNPSQHKWFAYSGAFFDMSRNDRRMEGWTSADASGMALFPGLVRYDEAANAAVTDIGHAFRVTLRDSNGYVYPASHVAGSDSSAPPLGTRLRLKTSVNGLDPALRTSDPISQKIFRAMQKYGLIVADNGSDMYISGTFDVRWNNDDLNPAFSTLTASDFEVIQLGWKPPANPVVLSAVSASPNPVVGGNSSTGTVTLSTAAPTGGALVTLSSASPTFAVPANVNVAQGATSANFTITTTPVSTTAMGTLSASYNSTTKTTTFTVNPAPTLSIGDVSLSEGNSGTKVMTFTVNLSAAASTAVTYDIATANGTATAGSDYVASTLSGQSIAAGVTSKTFAVTINGDTTIEPNETFTVNLSNASGATIADAQAIGTISNDDTPSLSIGDATISEGNSGTKLLTFTISLSQAALTAVTYNVSTPSSGTATAGVDYVSLPVTAQSIPAGTLSKTISVTLNGDTSIEANETFFVNVSSVVGATVADATAVGTISNDDFPSLSIGDVAVTEGNTGTKLLTFTVQLSATAGTPVTYNVSTPSSGTATAGVDYVTLPVTAQTIPAGYSSKTISVTLNGDTAIEANEAFYVNVSSVVGATVADATAVGTISNDDFPSLSIGDVAVGEGNSGTKLLTFTVQLSAAAGTPVTYKVSTPSSGTATAGVDYVTLPVTAQTIPAGQSSKTVSVTINGDTAVEANESFFVNVSSVVGATVADPTAVGTITNDD